MVPSSVRCYTFAVGGAGGGGVGGDAPGGAQMNASCFLPSSLSCNEIKQFVIINTSTIMPQQLFQIKMFKYKINKSFESKKNLTMSVQNNSN